MFIPQSPDDTDLLFDSVPGFLANLEVIAAHIAQPAATGAPSRPMTFGVYGAWGAGKSTALRRLHRLVTDQLPGTGGRVTTSHYSAPMWQSTGNPQATLAYTILNAIDPDAVFRAIRDHSDAHVLMAEDPGQPSSFARLAEAFQSTPALHQQWMASISHVLHDEVGPPPRGVVGAGEAPEGAQSTVPGATETLPHVHIVFIDDVDRCTHTFTAELLAATSFWDSPGHVNLFFVLAANEQHLVESLRTNLPLGAHTPEEALEKYVHLTVSVPEMMTSPQLVASFLAHLSEHVNSPSLSENQLAALREVILESADHYPNCVMAPLLQASPGLTPRAVKHRLNTFLAEFRPHGPLQLGDVKEWVIKAFWPDFWWRYLWPLGKTSPGEEERRYVDYVIRLTKYGRTLHSLWGLDDNELRPALEFLARQDGLTLDEVNPALAIYLATEPPWEPPESTGRLEFSIPDEPAEPTHTDETADAPENEVLLRYYQADQAQEEGNAAAAAQQLSAIMAIVRSGRLQRNAAASVGNAALIAERMRLTELARDLHLAAHKLDPRHFNVMQNLVSFINDAAQSDLYKEAERLLEILDTDGRAHKPQRTLALHVQLDALLGRPVEALRPRVERLLQSIENEPSVAGLAALVEMELSVLTVNDARRVGRVVAEAARDDLERHHALRMLADFIAQSDDPVEEREAAELYRFLLGRGLACQGDLNPFALWHNLATLYASLGYRAYAASIWRGLYDLQPTNQAMRRTFAVTLDSLGHDKAAAAVLLGQALPTLDLALQPVPESLLDGHEVDRWWERLPIGDHPPCPEPRVEKGRAEKGRAENGRDAVKS